jgi:hypothetical protein
MRASATLINASDAAPNDGSRAGLQCVAGRSARTGYFGGS